MKKVNFRFGSNCKQLYVDMEGIQEMFRDNGFEVTGYADADLVVYGTCAFKDEVQSQCINDIKKLSKEKECIVFGCLVDINESRLKKVFDGKFYSVKDKEKIREYFKGCKCINKGRDKKIGAAWIRLVLCQLKKIIPVGLKKALSNRLNNIELILSNDYVNLAAPYFISVASGCVGKCSYCVIKVARGNIKSKPMHKILEEIQSAWGKGYREFIFVGEDVGAYGLDNHTTLVALLKEVVLKFPGIKIQLGTFNPNFFLDYFDEMAPFYKGKYIFHVACALQSGSNKVIKSMNRNYDVQEVFEKMVSLKNLNKNIMLSTTFMVGYPTESHEDFLKTLNLARRCKSAGFALDTHIYRSMQGTQSSNLPDISLSIKQKRYQTLMDLINGTN